MKTMRWLIAAALLLIAGSAIFYVYRREPVRDLDDLTKGLIKKRLRHLGIIMDGNRRWARKNGLQPWLGHQAGIEPIKTAVSFCIDHDIHNLTLYVFSLENFKRPTEEIKYLFDILAKEIISKEFDELAQRGIKITFVGDRTLFPEKLLPAIQDIEQRTLHNDRLRMNLLFCYGGQQEMLAAAKKVGDLCVQRRLIPAQISLETFKECSWSHDIPAVDLLLRTAGDQRLSNFLPLQTAYSQLYFVSCYWPELTKQHLVDAVKFFINARSEQGA